MHNTRLMSSAMVISALCLQTTAQAGSAAGTSVFVGPAESQIWFGAGYLSEDNYHINRYTGPEEEGFYPHIELDLRYRGEGEDDARYMQLKGQDLGIGSRRVEGRYGVQGTYGVFMEYNQRTRYYDEDLQSPLRSDGRDRLRLPEGGSTADLEDWTRDWEVDRERRQLSVGVQRHVDEDWKVDASFSREEKEGRLYRGYGDWISQEGFAMPAPVDHRTDQFDISAAYSGEELQGRFGYHLSRFNHLDGVRSYGRRDDADQANYFEVEDPHSDDWGDPDVHTLSLAPDNTYQRVYGSAAYSFQPETTLHMNVDIGRAEQDEDFVEDTEYQQNLSILDESLNGQIDTTRIGVRGTHRFTPRVQIRGGYRYDDRDNSTPHYELQGNERTRVHSLTRHTADLDADIRLPARTNLLLGYEYEQTERDLADDDTQDHTVHTRVRSQVTDSLSGSIYASYLDRYGANYYGLEATQPGIASNVPTMRMYHLADLRRIEAGAIGSYAVIPELAIGLELTATEDDYHESAVGMLSDERYAYTLTVDYFPDEMISGYSFVVFEDHVRDQGGIQRDLTQDEEVLTVGLGGTLSLLEDERLELGAEVFYLQSDTDISVSDGGDFPTLEIRMTQLELYGEYAASEQLQLRLAYLGQSFEEQDWSRGFGPGWDDDFDDDMVLMGREAYDYTAHMMVASLGYRF
ncbi:outer membrane protein assembly factor YaeT precursor [Halorhodospira halochloris]|uniref:Outer membrane protein assembly factor YaeT n=1 Tax=Halorhodospira halochloris TaxID=1052 RepID=A0A120MZ87_HALHR|nr:MtrB/PioB family decaheme-associated outer membrane protein [Halorhodospira halochloris]MBK1650891.1 hypothetical protein [Halorhodospira halochloris]BAU56607.1 outer membrane protein assembly factor YaeT precursor [Halorhodospira halochloris]